LRKKSISPLVGKRNSVKITAVDLDANGIGRLSDTDSIAPGKVVFVQGAMIGER
jgi:23S rRNA (uracil1939-C5)-methyltransferase